MTNVKCLRCGAFNLIDGQVCKFCGIAFAMSGEPFPYPEFTGSFAHDPRYSYTTTMSSISPFDNVTDVLGPTLSVFTKNLWLITKIVVVIVAPYEFFKAFSGAAYIDDWQLSRMFFLGRLCNVLIAPALIYALMNVLQMGTAPGVNECYRWGFNRLGKLIICAAIVGLLKGLGFAMCFIPGIIAAVVFSIVYPLAVLETGSVVETLQRSVELTKGHRWKILGAGIVITLITSVISLPFSPAFGMIRDTLWPLQVLVAILVDIVEQLPTVLSLVIYLSIRRTLASGNSVIQ